VRFTAQPFGSTYTLAFSRILYPNEVLIAYNVSSSPRQDSVVVDATLHPDPSSMTYLYGGTGTVPVQSGPDGARFERGGEFIEAIIDEAPVREELLAYSGRVFELSLFISIVTASLVFATLYFSLVRPMQRLTQSMVSFQEKPEDAQRIIVPSQREDEIGQSERVLATIVFSDICDSTATLERIGDAEWTRVAREHNARIRTVIDRFRGREITNLGDGFLALFDGAGKAALAAAAMDPAVADLGIHVRAGVHTGEVARG
jgi:hypothetical protein